MPSQLSPYGSGAASYPRTNNKGGYKLKVLYVFAKEAFLSVFTHLTHKSEIKKAIFKNVRLLTFKLNPVIKKEGEKSLLTANTKWINKYALISSVVNVLSPKIITVNKFIDCVQEIPFLDFFPRRGAVNWL